MDRGLPRPPRRTYLDAHLSSLCTALLWKLGGIMTSHRSRVFFVFYFIFFFFTKKKLNPRNPTGAAWQEGPAGSEAPERRQQQRPPSTRRCQCRATLRRGEKNQKKPIFAH